MELDKDTDYKSTFVDQEPPSKKITRSAGKRTKKKLRKTRRKHKITRK
jgi:hypothetical protein